MSWATTKEWNTTQAFEIARKISSIPSLYCGPAAVGWIAAVWNISKGRPYDCVPRLMDKNLFPDGPRPFHQDLPGFQMNLSDLLKRETHNELKLSREIYHRSGSIYEAMEKHEMPIIIRMLSPRITDGLHYVTLYKSEKHHEQRKPDSVQFYWQDNGPHGNKKGLRAGLSRTDWKNAGLNMFFWGAKRVVKI